jgi:hypothetical protein|nr:MAG TPA: hypothetical protein [Caudoviricetes sp.]
MYDVNLYDRNIKEGNILIFYEIMEDSAICCFEVSNICSGSISMSIRTIRMYDGYYRAEFWK